MQQITATMPDTDALQNSDIRETNSNMRAVHDMHSYAIYLLSAVGLASAVLGGGQDSVPA